MDKLTKEEAKIVTYVESGAKSMKNVKKEMQRYQEIAIKQTTSKLGCLSKIQMEKLN